MESLMEAHKGAQTMASAAKKEETTGSLFKSSMFDSVTPFEVLMVEEFSDLNLVIGSHIIGVHQLVLASHSKLILSWADHLHSDLKGSALAPTQTSI